MIWMSICRKRPQNFLFMTQLPVYDRTVIVWRAAPPHLLAGEGDHVQGAVHEPPHHRLGPVLREDGVIDAMVRRHVLAPPGKHATPSEPRQ